MIKGIGNSKDLEGKLIGNVRSGPKPVAVSDKKREQKVSDKNEDNYVENKTVRNSIKSVRDTDTDYQSHPSDNLDNINIQIERTEKEIEAQKNEIENICDFIKELKESKSEINNDIASMQSEYNSLINEANNTDDEEEKSYITKQAQTLKETLEETKKQLDEIEESIKLQNDELNTAQNKIEQLEKNLTELKNKQKRLQQEIDKPVRDNTVKNRDDSSESDDLDNNLFKKQQPDIQSDNINVAKEQVNIPENLSGNYYGIYNHLLNDAKADNVVQSLIKDKNIWSKESSTLGKKELTRRLDEIFNVNGSIFKDKGSYIVDKALENGINPEMFAAKIMAENDLGTAQKSNEYQNPGWIRGDDNKYIKYNSVEEGIDAMARLLANGYNLANESKSMVEVDSVYAPGNTQYSELLAKRLMVIQNYYT